MDAEPLLKLFADAGIPVFVQDGENYVREGALLLVASTDNQGVGQFVAEVIAQVAHGVAAGEHPLRIRFLALYEHQPGHRQGDRLPPQL